MTLSSDASPIWTYLVSGPSVRERLEDLIGHSDPAVAKQRDPQCIRALYGIDEARNCVWWTRSEESYQMLYDKVFRNRHGDDGGGHSQQREAVFELDPIQEALLLIKPGATTFADKIEQKLMTEGFYTAHCLEINKTKSEWGQFYHLLRGNVWFDEFCEWMASDTVLAYSLYRVNAIEQLFEVVGPTNPDEAKAHDPGSLRAQYGTTRMKNGFHFCFDEESVQRERVLLFPSEPKWPLSVPKEKLLVIIKPNAAHLACDRIRAHLVGNGFEIVTEREAHFQEHIYKELDLNIAASDHNYPQSVMYIATGPIVVLVIQKVNGYGDIVDVVGDRDVDIARQRQPESIRAIYGRSLVENAIDVSLNAVQYRRNFEIFFGDDGASASGSPEAEGPSSNPHRHLHEYSDSMSIVANGAFGGGNHKLTLNEQR